MQIQNENRNLSYFYGWCHVRERREEREERGERTTHNNKRHDKSD
jgi:hypothetical protein